MAQEAKSIISRILVPFDFGEPAARALDVAVELASKFEAKVLVLHVNMLPRVEYVPYFDWPTEEFERSAREALDTVLSRVKDRYTQVEGIVVTGEPWQAILDIAKERNMSLIVMGTQGRQGLSHMLLGSVAEKVVRLSPIPVMTISAHGEPGPKQDPAS